MLTCCKADLYNKGDYNGCQKASIIVPHLSCQTCFQVALHISNLFDISNQSTDRNEQNKGTCSGGSQNHQGALQAQYKNSEKNTENSHPNVKVYHWLCLPDVAQGNGIQKVGKHYTD